MERFSQEPFVGEIMIAAFNFAPRGWASCNGQIMVISQNQALYALLGTTYGGNGVQTFGLPNLQGRVPIGFGSGAAGTYSIGQTSGTVQETLVTNQIPAHMHSISNSSPAPSQSVGGIANAVSPSGNYFANQPTLNTRFSKRPDELTPAAAITLQNTGGGQPHSNMMPSLVLNFIIALQGIFPSRN